MRAGLGGRRWEDRLFWLIASASDWATEIGSGQGNRIADVRLPLAVRFSRFGRSLPSGVNDWNGVGSGNPAKDQIPGMPTKFGKALMRSIQLRTLA